MTITGFPPCSCWSGHILTHFSLLGDCEWLRNSLGKCVQMGGRIVCSQPVYMHIWYANQIISAALAIGHLIGCRTAKWIWLISVEIHKGLLLIKCGVSSRVPLKCCVSSTVAIKCVLNCILNFCTNMTQQIKMSHIPWKTLLDIPEIYSFFSI